MLDISQLRVTERESGVRYPAALWAVVTELQSLSGAPGFVTAFSDVRTATQRDIQEARERGLPESLTPFACDPQSRHTDYYCCGTDGGPEVAVFAVHTVVADWQSFESFVEWVRHQLAEQTHAEQAAPPDHGGD